MILRTGAPPRPDRTYRPRPGVYAILPLADRLLLTRQHGSQEALQLPGGGVDPGESPLTALHREVLEETGWRLASPRRLDAVRRYVYMPEYDLWAEKLCTVYLARPVREVGPPSEPNHSVEVLSAERAAFALSNAGDRLMVARALIRGWIR